MMWMCIAGWMWLWMWTCRCEIRNKPFVAVTSGLIQYNAWTRRRIQVMLPASLRTYRLFCHIFNQKTTGLTNVSKYQNSRTRRQVVDFFIFCLNKPYGKLFSKNALKVFELLHVYTITTPTTHTTQCLFCI